MVRYPPQANFGSEGHFILQEESGSLVFNKGGSTPQKHSVLKLKNIQNYDIKKLLNYFT